MKKILSITILLFIQYQLNAQLAYLKAANNFYTEGDYYSAAQYYEKYLSGKPEKNAEFNPYVIQKPAKPSAIKAEARTEVLQKLAESYYNLHFFSKAEPFYMELKEAKNVQAIYYLAKCLRAQNKPAEAELAFTEFVNTNTTDNDLINDSKNELTNLKFAKDQLNRKDLRKFLVGKSQAINTTGGNYAPSFVNKQLFFTSTRPDSAYNPKKPSTNKVYMADDAKATTASRLNLPLDIAQEQGVASFSADGKKMYLTKWKWNAGKKEAAIYISSLQENNWTAPLIIGENVNAPGSSTQQPFATTDGKSLLFSSNRTGGLGKNDLYIIRLDAGGIPTGDAQNLTSINTTGDDEAPYYHSKTKTLVFASNGRVGMGGFDLYSATGDATNFTVPQNIGYPLNSVKDDIYYAAEANSANAFTGAVFSSDRESPCCLELFSFDKIKIQKKLSGTVVDCKTNLPVSNATVVIKDINDHVLGLLKTDASGRYTFTSEEFTSEIGKIVAEGYTDKEFTITITDKETDNFNNGELCINKPELPVLPEVITPPTPEVPNVEDLPNPLILDNVLYSLNSAALRPASYVALNKVLAIMNKYPKMIVELSSHTDNLGETNYNQQLSLRRAQACVNYLISKGIAKDRITAKGYGETKPIAPNQINGKDNPAGRQKNRRTEVYIIKAE